MTLFAIASLTCAITCIVLAIIAAVYGTTKLHRILLLFNVSVAVWGIGCFFAGIARSEQEALLFWRMSHVGGLSLTPSFYYLVHTFLNSKTKIDLQIIKIWWVIMMVFCFYPGLFFYQTYLFREVPFYNLATPIYPVMFFSYLITVTISFTQLVFSLPKTSGIKRLQTIYVIFGFLTGFIGGTMTLLPLFKINVPSWGNFTIVLYCIIITYAILKHRILDLNVAITRASIFIIVYAAVIGFPVYLGYKTNLWLWATLSMAILASIGPFIYRMLLEKAESIILAEQRRYQTILIQAAEGMAKEPTLARVLKLIVYLVKMTVKVRFGAVFICDEGKRECTLRAYRNSGAEPGQLSYSEDHPFASCVNSLTEPILSEELPEEVKETVDEKFHHGLIVPLNYAKKHLGFMVFGEKLNGKMYSEDDIKAFKILAQQSALAIVSRSNII